MVIKKGSDSKAALSVAPATDGMETLEQLQAKIDAIKAKEGKPLLDRLAEVEQEADAIRGKLRIMGVPVPPRIIVDISDENVHRVLLTLYKVSNNAGMSLTDLETSTGFKGVRMVGIRKRLETEPASIRYTTRGMSKVVSLTKEGLEEAEDVAATNEGKEYLAELEARIAEAKANKR